MARKKLDESQHKVTPKDNNYAAQYKYDAKNAKNFTMKLNLNTDKDIWDKLAAVDNKQGYIKALIRKDIEENGI